jgi:hypothetical protein
MICTCKRCCACVHAWQWHASSIRHANIHFDLRRELTHTTLFSVHPSTHGTLFSLQPAQSPHPTPGQPSNGAASQQTPHPVSANQIRNLSVKYENEYVKIYDAWMAVICGFCSPQHCAEAQARSKCYIDGRWIIVSDAETLRGTNLLFEFSHAGNKDSDTSSVVVDKPEELRDDIVVGIFAWHEP